MALDIGTEAVKALIFKPEGKKTIILGSSLEYFGRYGVFDSRDFETELMKRTISKAIVQAVQSLSFPLAKKELKKRAQAQKKWQVYLTLSAVILKARMVSQSFLREEPKKRIFKTEEKNIYQNIFRAARKRISQEFAKTFGIMPSDIQWISMKVLETKIDGYQVSQFEGYEGKDLNVKVLVVFSPKYYLENIKRIAESLGLEILNIAHEAEGLPLALGTENKNGIFVDIGGEVTQVFLLKNGVLQQVTEFGAGAKIFSQKLSETLGINEETARILKERYSNKSLSAQTSKRIKEIFLEEKKTWYENLKLQVKKTNSGESLSSTIFLFGGGAQLPEIQEVLKENGVKDREDLSIFTSPEIKIIYPKDLKDIEDTSKSLKSPQYVPPLLISCRY